MGYYIFRCSDCGANLVAEDPSPYATLECAACLSVFVAPPPRLRFPCRICLSQFFAPANLQNEAVACPKCETLVNVPQNTILVCPACKSLIEPDNDYYLELIHQEIPCPVCGVPFVVPPLIEGAAADAAPPPAEAAPEAAPACEKTMCLDRIVANIPQFGSVNRGVCPYCRRPIEKIDERVYVCRRCHRVITTRRRRVTRF